MSIAVQTERPARPALRVSETPGVDFVRIRFAGDSGDGVQLTGTQFAGEAARFGYDFATFPDYPAEIRAPAGTTYGVSAYSINIGQTEIMTSGDQPDMLVALNPAALRVHVADLVDGGTLLVDSGAFADRAVKKAGYESNPLEDGTLARFQVIALDISALTLGAVAHMDLSRKAALRCKNMWTLGLVLWMFGRDRAGIERWLEAKFKAQPDVLEANRAALRAGHAYGETAEMGPVRRYDIPAAPLPAGTYRTVTGNEALSLGLHAGARLAGLKLFLGSYPITPASPILHHLARAADDEVTVLQAEDEIAAVCAAIGASYAGALGVTASSGPGIDLKAEAIGLAISCELPLVVVNVQRAGPSTGMPTKAEQADLLHALFGRHGDSPLPVIAAASAPDCFDCAIEAARLATRFMTPVILLSDAYLANAAEPWLLPDPDDPAYAPFPVSFRTDPEGFHPFLRDAATRARPWVVPGTKGLRHRIGGLEKDYESGNVSYVPANHQRMTDVRAAKILGIADHIPEQTVDTGNERGRLAVVGWGSTYGAIRVAVRRELAAGRDVSHIHLRHLWPLPRNLDALLDGFERIVVPEVNTGQLSLLLEARLKRPVRSLPKVAGQPFKVTEIQSAIRAASEQ